MNIDLSLLAVVETIAKGIRQQIVIQGRPMLPEEQAAMMVCFGLQEACQWLELTLDRSTEERFEIALQLKQLYCNMLAQ